MLAHNGNSFLMLIQSQLLKADTLRKQKKCAQLEPAENGNDSRKRKVHMGLSRWPHMYMHVYMLVDSIFVDLFSSEILAILLSTNSKLNNVFD